MRGPLSRARVRRIRRANSDSRAASPLSSSRRLRRAAFCNASSADSAPAARRCEAQQRPSNSHRAWRRDAAHSYTAFLALLHPERTARRNIDLPSSSGRKPSSCPCARRLRKLPRVCVLAHRRNGALCIGVTSAPRRRVWQHGRRAREGFTRRHPIGMSVRYEVHATLQSAVARERH